jgi:hypothetical protein
LGAEEKLVEIAGVAIIQPRLTYENRLTMAAYSPTDPTPGLVTGLFLHEIGKLDRN